MKTIAPTVGLGFLFWVVYIFVNRTDMVVLIFLPAFYALGMYVYGISQENEDPVLYKGCVVASLLFMVSLIALVGLVIVSGIKS
ncbi:MAG: hypothetical protein COV07_04280 [Candidatus Vogelbacteria bacterium CG10_big_fil_rev_8_21_14_0_10_45_14]|uniref:Uncharacterized protein n=1 Tax=Candidatus Vogelbacteria bacterium CG10_big_fil_rev_8_21_14_0_10_45_14 TaxID=1975042 RepID=A0A2H0RIG3_9BACT|nr:MAG: hypothetical protein COV07_04280 [Candidatus Vogelbacteria bacterium CG10_big_fil_rev_8_21_14_0_10_45_14]